MTDFQQKIVAAYINDRDLEITVHPLLWESCSNEERSVLLVLSEALDAPRDQRLAIAADACGMTVKELVSLLVSAGQRVPVET